MVKTILNAYLNPEVEEDGEGKDVFADSCLCLNPDPACVLYKRQKRERAFRRIKKYAVADRVLEHYYSEPCSKCKDRISVPYETARELGILYPHAFCGAKDLSCLKNITAEMDEVKKRQRDQEKERDPSTKTDEQLIESFLGSHDNCLRCSDDWYVSRELEKRGYMVRPTFEVLKVVDVVPEVCGDVCEFHTPEEGFECPDACPHQDNNHPPEATTSDTSEAPE